MNDVDYDNFVKIQISNQISTEEIRKMAFEMEGKLDFMAAYFGGSDDDMCPLSESDYECDEK